MWRERSYIAGQLRINSERLDCSVPLRNLRLLMDALSPRNRLGGCPSLVGDVVRYLGAAKKRPSRWAGSDVARSGSTSSTGNGKNERLRDNYISATKTK